MDRSRLHNIYCGDVSDTLVQYNANAFDGCLCDPPYGLDFMGRAWDGVVPDVNVWTEVLRVLKPGAFLLAFGGCRTYHRLACAVEDAGFRLFPFIAWTFGSGFPKATRFKCDGWDEYRYGLQALKPALEPILMAQVPMDGTGTENALAWGCGGIWVDGCRIACNDKAKFPAGVVSETEYNYGGGDGMYADRQRPDDSIPQGRWPANLLLSHASLPVMRMCGRIPPEAEMEIRRYFDGYAKVSELRNRVRDAELDGSERSQVLQPGMCKQSKEGKDPARVCSGESGIDMPAMRPGVRDLEGMGEKGQAQVLQLGLQDSVSEDVDREKKREAWSPSHRRSESENEDTETARQRQSPLEGGKILGRERLSICPSEQFERGNTEVSCTNGDEIGIHSRAPADYGDRIGETASDTREGSSYQRGSGRQQTRESTGISSRGALSETSRDRQGVEQNPQGKRVVEERNSSLEILACDIPERWIEFFEYTGEELGCECVGERRVKTWVHVGRNLDAGTDSPRSVYGKYNRDAEDKGHADPDGKETIADWRCVEGCPVRILGEQSGERMHGAGHARDGKFGGDYDATSYDMGGAREMGRFGDTGTAARFFYQAKASRSERNLGLDDFYWQRDKSSPIGFTRISRDEWEQLPQRQRAQGNIHPTVKPLGILEYIARLIMPPESRRLLVPFCGSGSEMLGAIRAGWHEVVGIDIVPEYCEMAEARLVNYVPEPQQTEFVLAN